MLEQYLHIQKEIDVLIIPHHPELSVLFIRGPVLSVIIVKDFTSALFQLDSSIFPSTAIFSLFLKNFINRLLPSG